MKSRFQEEFFRFENLVRAAQQLPSFPKLDAIEKELLFFIGFAHECNMPLLIGDLLAKSEVASQATIHGRLGMLYKKQLIKWQSDSDGRKKYAVPTSKGVAYFSRIGECVYKAAIEK